MMGIRGLTIRIATCALLLQVVHALNLRIEPQNAHIRATVKDMVTITCYSDETLNGCQFKVYEPNLNRELPTFDLNQGNVTEEDKVATIPKLFGRITNYEYVGKGLQHGECGINITTNGTTTEKFWVVGCRVRSTKGGAWQHAEMSIYGNEQKTFNMTRPPGKFVVLPGDSVAVLFKGDAALSYCWFTLPITRTAVNYNSGHSSAATSLYHYHGESLAAGECGIELHRVNEQRNGWLEVTYRTRTDTLEWLTTAIVVAKAPDSVELEINTTNMTENSTLIATCTAKNSRPVSRLVWFIGDNLVRQDEMDDTPGEDWKWPQDVTSITQVLAVKLTKKHHNKEIKCLVEHISLNYAMLARKTIKLYCNPEVSKCCDL